MVHSSSPIYHTEVIAHWRPISVLVLFGCVAVSAAEVPVVARLPATEVGINHQALAAELDALSTRIEELESGSPSLDLFAFQGECNSSVYCSTKDGNFCANFGGRIELDSVWASADTPVESVLGPIEDLSLIHI